MIESICKYKKRGKTTPVFGKRESWFRRKEQEKKGKTIERMRIFISTLVQERNKINRKKKKRED